MKNRLTILVVVSSIVLLVLLFLAGSLYHRPEVTINWETESELNTAGFHILRASSPEGDFTRITDQLIPPAEDPLSGDEYTYRDVNVEAGNTYYYKLEEVETTGSTNQYDLDPVTVQGGINWMLAGIWLATTVGLLWYVRYEVPADEEEPAEVS